MQPPPREPRRLLHVIEGMVFALVLALGAWQGIAAIGSDSAWNRLRPTLSLEAFLAGRTTGAVNDIMARHLPLDPWLRAVGGVLRWNVFHSGGPQVRSGCDGWMFLTEELRPWPDAEAAMAERAAGVAGIAAKLHEQGIALAITLVPDKARIEQAELCGARRAAQTATRYDDFLADLRARGLTTISLVPALHAVTAAFYRTDTHWNQRGAAAAAAAIAAALAGQPMQRSESFVTTADPAAERIGDLLRLASLDLVPDWLRPAPDQEGFEHTALTEGAAPSGGLLDEAPAPEVVLLGSSYSTNGNFHGRLQQALHSTVVNFGQAGGAFLGAAQSYFASAAFRESPPKLIIWEIPERVVAQPLSAGDRDFLAKW